MNTKQARLGAWLLGALGLVLATRAGAQSLPLTTLVSFNTTNGAYPQAGLTLGPDGSLYGATYSGGTNQYGTVFIRPAERAVKPLYFTAKPLGKTVNRSPTHR